MSLIPLIHYLNLEKLVKDLKESELNQDLELLFGNNLSKSTDFEALFFNRIFGDSSFQQDRALDPHEYFDFSVWDVTNEQPKSVFSTSTGETAGVAFLIYANALDILRKQSRHQGELIIYVDESGKCEVPPVHAGHCVGEPIA